MALETNTGKATFVNISKGKLYTKEKEKQAEFFDAISGVITKVGFKTDSYEGKEYEKCEITLIDGDDKFILGMRTDSGYFRGFCNSLKSGNPTDRVRIAPNMKESDGRTQTTCFVSQNNKALKHAHTRENMGNMPQVKQVTFKGKTEWDGTDQIVFFKNWLNSVQWQHEAIAEPYQQNNINVQHQYTNASEITEPLDDLPF